MPALQGSRTISGAVTPTTNDDGWSLRVTSNATVTLTNSGWTVGRSGMFFPVTGAASVTFVAGASVTVRNVAGDLVLGRQYDGATALYTDTNTWTIYGSEDPQIPAGYVTGAMMEDETIGAAKLGTFAVTSPKINDLAVTTGKLADAAVTLAKQANLAQDRIIGRVSSGTGVPEALTPAQVREVADVPEGGVVNANSLRIGPSAGASWTTGTSNTATGNVAMQFATTAQQCTAFGSSALRSNVSGFGNTAVGSQALNAMTSAESTGVGRQAGLLATGVGTTVFGYNAGDTITTGSANVLVGRNADVTTGTISNASALGDGATVGHAGSVALGQGVTTTAVDQVAVGARDVEVQASDHGLILRSPDGTRWRVTVDNSGVLNTTSL